MLSKTECSVYIKEGNKCAFGHVKCSGIYVCMKKYPELFKIANNK